jgi:hypothetical protein
MNGMKKSMLDPELALIAQQARRLLGEPQPEVWQRRSRIAAAPARKWLEVVADDAVWPSLRGYPFGQLA